MTVQMTLISRRQLLSHLFALPLYGVVSGVAWADGDEDADDSGDNDTGGNNDNDQDNHKNTHIGLSLTQDAALAAVQNGKAVSLPLLLAFMSLNYPGEILDVRLRKLDAQYIYEVRYLVDKTQLRVLKLEAKTLKKF
jgi:uncharacterized membrane protein YkoI